GDRVTARKRTNDGRTIFDLVVQCSASRMTISIESYLSDAQPNTYVVATNMNLWGMRYTEPQGRSKVAGRNPESLGRHFVVSEYNNVIHMHWDWVRPTFNKINGTAVKDGDE